MKRKVCVVTGSRAEYGILRTTLKKIKQAPDLQLQLVVTGMHLSPEFGFTRDEIEADGFEVSYDVDMLLSADSSSGIAKSIGLGIIGFADAFHQLKPDLVLLLGDRFEILAAASAALVAVIPIAHIHGGEVTTGAFDDAIRHSVTKMSSLHFTSTSQYRDRVIQLGESPDKVFNVGAPGVENIRHTRFLEKNQLEASLEMELTSDALLVTFHPVTLEPGQAKVDFQNLLDVLDRFKERQIIFTKANADTEGRIINTMIDSYVSRRESAYAFTSLGQTKYFSLLKHVSGVVGNSSSGIIEAPSFNVGTINLGDRQRGRVRAKSVIDCDSTFSGILSALEHLFSGNFTAGLADVVNPYEGGDSSQQIVEIIRHTALNSITKKHFYDLK